MTKADGELKDAWRATLGRKLCVLPHLIELEDGSVLTFPQICQYLAGKGTPVSRSPWTCMRGSEGSLATDKELLQNLAKFSRVDSRDLLEEGSCIRPTMDVRLSAHERAMRRILFGATVAALIGGAATLLAAVYFARQVVVPRTKRVEDLQIRRVFTDANGRQLIELPSSTRTMSPGLYSLWFAGGSGHACIGSVVTTDDKASTVTRMVERVDSGQLSTATAGIWSGYVYPTPTPLGLPYEDVEIPVENGPGPAWKFAPTDASIAPGVWGIHIHGMGGTKAGALRGVPVADRLGLTSLVVSYRNDGQAPASADGRHNLGQSEWRDVEAALAYAVDKGATRIFLFGWSLGGSIALQAAARSKYRRQIVGLILDAPVFDWTSTLMANARAARLPKPAAALGLRLLESTPLRRITGLHEGLELSALDWLARAQELQTPMLVLHSENDRSTPFDVSQQMALARPDLLTLIPFRNVEHTQEWNIEMKRWEQAVFSWVAPRTRPL